MNLANVVKFILLLFIDFYKLFVSPFYPPVCRFYPTCSCYARESLIKHGLLRGVFLSFKRICKCHPFNSGGYDPVPPSINRFSNGK